jgi:hypothetical protein
LCALFQRVLGVAGRNLAGEITATNRDLLIRAIRDEDVETFTDDG